ncbi:hypothetical protein GTA08_BOTSDO07504 [Botryosphaeria dothidea]|uniref:Uncharacterized protein n=1 Tax=Botryosphaeria dothidea TaxID=55169 RepID=A0A8H4IP78_9PEZI|nr:hypothetical protein GTA08_BOTSDO07504 [Botryosphaeria dothidea]
MTIYSTDGSVSKDSSLCKWLGYVQDGMKRIGLESEPGLYLEKWVKDVGFTNVHHKVFPYPVGPWPKDKTLVQGWEKEEVDVLVANVRKDLKNKSMHPQHDLHVVYAQKPMDAA